MRGSMPSGRTAVHWGHRARGDPAAIAPTNVVQSGQIDGQTSRPSLLWANVLHLCGTPVDSVTRAATVRVWTAGHHCVSFQDMVTAFSKVLASSATRSSYVRRPCRTEIFTGSHCSVFENRARSAVQCEPGAHRQWLATRTRSLGAPAHRSRRYSPHRRSGLSGRSHRTTGSRGKISVAAG